MHQVVSIRVVLSIYFAKVNEHGVGLDTKFGGREHENGLFQLIRPITILIIASLPCTGTKAVFHTVCSTFQNDCM